MSEVREGKPVFAYACENHLTFVVQITASIAKNHDVNVRPARIGPNMPLCFKSKCSYEDCRAKSIFRVSTIRNRIWHRGP